MVHDEAENDETGLIFLRRADELEMMVTSTSESESSLSKVFRSGESSSELNSAQKSMWALRIAVAKSNWRTLSDLSR